MRVPTLRQRPFSVILMRKERMEMNKKRERESGRASTKPEGRNPKADDSPEHDVHHDRNRRNQYDPEVGEALKTGKRKGSD